MRLIEIPLNGSTPSRWSLAEQLATDVCHANGHVVVVSPCVAGGGT